jgi:3,4-dihydroxy-2-butanone 4-phosphate synthase
MAISKIEDAITALARGGVVADDEGRENEPTSSLPRTP